MKCQLGLGNQISFMHCFKKTLWSSIQLRYPYFNNEHLQELSEIWKTCLKVKEMQVSFPTLWLDLIGCRGEHET